MNHLLTLADAVATHARLAPEQVSAPAIRAARLTFAAWHERATRLANGLLALGLDKGDRVAVLAYNCVEWMEIYVALARAGLVAVPINFRLPRPRSPTSLDHMRGARRHRAGRAVRACRGDPRTNWRLVRGRWVSVRRRRLARAGQATKTLIAEAGAGRRRSRRCSRTTPAR